MKLENNLGTDAIRPLVLRIAIPSMLAQFVSVLYSIVDRIYISNIPLVGETALAGVGVCGPVVTLIGAFASLIGVGGAPLMSIRMGAGKTEEARRILSNSFLMLCVCSVALMAGVFPLRQPMLMAFGITTVDASKVISTDLKGAGHRIYLVRHTPLENRMPDTAQLKDNFGFVSENIERGNILAAWSVGFGGVAEGLAKMAFGNRIGAEVEMDEAELFGYAYGSILVESAVELTHPAAGLLGMTAAEGALTVNGVKMPLDALYKANTEKFAAVYPDKGENHAGVMTSEPAPRTFAYRGEAVEHPLVYIPVFPGTNCDYDTAKAFRKAGAEVEMSVLCNLGGDDILRSIREMKEHIRRAHIFVLSGGFSSGDEPDGSAKFIVNVLNNKDIRDEIHALLDRGGLILGICNGFQALVKSGLLPYGRLGMVTKESPTLFRNDINRHISQIVSTRVSTLNSPWLAGFGLGDIHSIAVSHGEGKFVVSEELARELFANGQVAFQYVDPEGRATAEAPYNPNGSSYAIEGLVSRDGQILGKMGHTERYEKNLFKNIAGEKEQSLFRNAVDYFRKN